MTVAAITGQPPQTVRDEWDWLDVERFLLCLPGIRQFEHALLYGGE